MSNEIARILPFTSEIAWAYHIPSIPEFVAAQGELRRQLSPNDAQGTGAIILLYIYIYIFRHIIVLRDYKHLNVLVTYC
jgi:hypothetical protein